MGQTDGEESTGQRCRIRQSLQMHTSCMRRPHLEVAQLLQHCLHQHRELVVVARHRHLQFLDSAWIMQVLEQT